MIQTYRLIRHEALSVLCRENTFFARMTQTEQEQSFSFEKQRFSCWLKAFGPDSDAEIRRVRNVTFGVEWSSLEKSSLEGGKEDGGGGSFERRICDVSIRIFKGDVTVTGSRKIAAAPSAPFAQIEAFIAELLESGIKRREGGEGLGYEEWMAVWEKVQGLMASGWGSPY
jgi:hypothetical protein